MLLEAGAVIGRAADFFGPDAPLSILREHPWKRVLAGKPAQLFGDPDQLHTHSFTPDVARGLVALGSRADARRVWMLPVQPAETTRAVVGRFAAALGREIAISAVPTRLVRAIGLFDPTMRELAEMTCQWKQPYVVDDAKLRSTFGSAPRRGTRRSPRRSPGLAAPGARSPVDRRWRSRHSSPGPEEIVAGHVEEPRPAPTP